MVFYWWRSWCKFCFVWSCSTSNSFLSTHFSETTELACGIRTDSHICSCPLVVTVITASTSNAALMVSPLKQRQNELNLNQIIKLKHFLATHLSILTLILNITQHGKFSVIIAVCDKPSLSRYTNSCMCGFSISHKTSFYLCTLFSMTQPICISI